MCSRAIYIGELIAHSATYILLCIHDKLLFAIVAVQYAV